MLAAQKSDVKINRYQTDQYSILVADNWDVSRLSKNKFAFFGPEVGDSRVGFYVDSFPRKGKNYKKASELAKVTQSENSQYIVLKENKFSGNGAKAIMRRSCWLSKEHGTLLVVREIFTQNKKHIFRLSSSIPNNTGIQEIDNCIVTMMNSFRFIHADS